MNTNCESCGAKPPIITSGPFSGQHGLNPTCENCGKNLCVKCLMEGRCFDSPDKRHLNTEEEFANSHEIHQ